MELRHLRTFVAAAEALHFTRAAELLDVAQPTLSLQIRELERELGTPLFDRVGRSVRLTEAGEIFRRHAVRALREVEAGQGALADLQGLRRGLVRVGVTHSFSARLIPRAVARFRLDHPGVAVAVSKTSGRAVEQGLIAGSIDLGIAYAPPEDHDVRAETLFDEQVVVVVAPDHPLSREDRVELAQLGRHPLALITREFSTRRLFDDRLRDAGITPTIAVEMNDIDSLLEVVRLGAGASVLSRRAVADPASQGLVLIAIDGPELTRTAALLWHPETHQTAAALAFAQVVRDLAGGS